MNSRSKLWFVMLLTFVRFPLVLLFFTGAVIHSLHPHTWLFWLTFAALIAAAMTDFLDGYYARKFGVVTRLGAHADPLMDKFFYLASLPLLVFVATKDGHLPHGVFLLVLTLLFLARDQWVTFLRSIGSMYNVSGSANWSGKLRTCINFPLICSIYYFEESPFPFVNAVFLYVFESAALVVNTLSLYVYTARYWPYLRSSTDMVGEGSARTDRTNQT
jgi:CDP-diacylglycerol--glycerol-3-phosphate 3-phosphatidyltransferase